MGSAALVLGGGGIAGIAWEVGLLVGLKRAGIDLTGSDLVIGTSAGSVVGSLVATGVDLEQAIAEQRVDFSNSPAVDVDFAAVGELFTTMADTSLAEADRLLRVGEIANRLPEGDQAARLAYFGRRLPIHDWPTDRRLVITGVDTVTGEFHAWDRDSGVPLVHAVAASCSVPAVYPPVTIDGRRYMDGGMRSGTNADLAAGASSVVVIAPMARHSPLGAPPAEVDALRESADVTVIAPDDAALEAFGPNVLAPHTAAPSLAAGLSQAAALAPRWP